MDKDPTFVRLGNDVFEWIEILRFSHLAGQKFGPGLNIGFVKSVGHRPDLKDNSVKPQPFGEIEAC
jgi:hypothetical protein